MGQYHKLVNLDKKEYVEPYGLGLGSKQYEHTGCEASLADAIYLLVMSSPGEGGGDHPLTEASGRWCGDRVVVLGDYTKDTDIPGYEDAKSLFAKLDSETNTEFLDITAQVRDAFTKTWEVKFELKPVTVGKLSWNSWQRSLLH